MGWLQQKVQSMDSDKRFRKNSLKNIFLINKMNDQLHKRGEKYDNEDDRRRGYLAKHRRYSVKRIIKKWHCESCNKTLNLKSKKTHLKSKKHQRNDCHTCSESEL